MYTKPKKSKLIAHQLTQPSEQGYGESRFLCSLVLGFFIIEKWKIALKMMLIFFFIKFVTFRSVDCFEKYFVEKKSEFFWRKSPADMK